MAASEGLEAMIDADEARAMVSAELARDPGLLNELHEIFFDQKTRREPGALFNYLFVRADSVTGGANNIVGFRLRNADERLAARNVPA